MVDGYVRAWSPWGGEQFTFFQMLPQARPVGNGLPFSEYRALICDDSAFRWPPQTHTGRMTHQLPHPHTSFCDIHSLPF